jgi:pSer/pThr/pTyr-binding forkhead associated (FHA) protein
MPRVTITVPEKTAQPYRFQLDNEVVTIGRGEDNDIPIDSGSVSTRHAEMRRVHGGYELHDIGSTNGIALDGYTHPMIALTNGASVTIGDAIFDFTLTEGESAVLSGERNPAPAYVLPPPNPIGNPGYPMPSPPQIYLPAKQGTSLGSKLLFLILAAAAFCLGLAIRYQNDTGGSLLEAVKSHSAQKAQTSPANL